MGNPYLETRIRTAGPLELVVQLYDGVLRHIESARVHHAERRVRERGDAISRALAIVGELRSSLDLERGAEIARNLDALYVFASERLLHANRSASAEPLGEAVRVLSPLRDAWAELAARPPETLAPPAGEAG